MIIQINSLTCLRCGHVWVPKQVDVRVCPKCKSYKWDKPKQEGSKDDRKNEVRED